MSDSVLSVRVGFVVDGVALVYVFLQLSEFSPVTTFHGCSILIFIRVPLTVCRVGTARLLDKPLGEKFFILCLCGVF
jgi:hypothetical protein